MQKEEKQLEMSLEALIQRVAELKNSIGSFIAKLEHEYETMSWPSVLDNFALLSGQLDSLGRLLKSDKVPPLKNQLILPLEISPDEDENLRKLTENRLCVFNHEVAPNFLRTKPLPDVEEKTQALTTKAQLVSQDAAQKQLNNLNKVTSNLLDIINSAKDEWEKDASQKSAPPQTSSIADTNTLVATALFGKNIRSSRGRLSESPQSSQQQQQQQQQKMQTATVNKAPSTIKTQIKAGAQSHPYQRP